MRLKRLDSGDIRNMLQDENSPEDTTAGHQKQGQKSIEKKYEGVSDRAGEESRDKKISNETDTTDSPNDTSFLSEISSGISSQFTPCQLPTIHRQTKDH